MQRTRPTFWRIGGTSGWTARTANADLAVSDREGLRLAAAPGGPLSLTSRDGSLGGLILPRGMALDADGRVHLLVGGSTIKSFDPESRTFAALPFGGGTDADPRYFARASSIAIAERRLYVCDSERRRVLVFDLDAFVLLRAYDARGTRANWQPVDLAEHDGSVYILDRAGGRVFRHTPTDHLVFVFARPDRAGRWTRLAIDRGGRIYLLDETVPAAVVLDTPDPLAPPIVDAGSIRDRFDPPALRLDHGSARFCLPADLTGACGWRRRIAASSPEIPLAACPPFNRRADHCDTKPKPPRTTRTAQGDYLLYVVEREQRRVNAFTAGGRRLRHAWGPGLDWQPVDVAALGEFASILDEHNQAVYRHQAGRETLRLLFADDPPAHAWSRIAAADSGMVYLHAPGQATAQIYDCHGTPRGDIEYRLVADVFARTTPPAPPLSSAALVFDRTGTPVAASTIDWSDPNVVPLYRRSGRWFSNPLDSEIYQCQWHRIELNLEELPPGSTIEVHTFAHESAEDVVPLRNDAGVKARWQHAYTIVAPSARARCDDGTDRSIDFLVQSGGGRYLSICITIGGDGFSTPAVGTLTVHYPRDSYRQYLPATYSADDESRLFLERFLSVFQTEWDRIDHTIDQVERLFDPEAVPAGPFLEYLATQWLGLTLEGDWTAEQKRRLLVAAPEIYKRHGQLAGLRQFVAVYLANLAGLDTTEVTRAGFPVIVEGFRERQHLFVSGGHAATLCESGPLWSASVTRRLQLGVFARERDAELVSTGDPVHDVFTRYAHRFRVFVPAGWVRTAAAERMLRRAIETEKPAQTQYDLCLVGARFRVEAQSTVGVDTILGATPVTALGCVLDPDRAPGLPPEGRLGYDTVLGCGRVEAAARLTPGMVVARPVRLA
jgi:phage tail-like protein